MSKLYRSLLWSGLVAAGVAACGDDVTVQPPAPPPALTVHSISVAPSGITIGIGAASAVTLAAAVNADASVATSVTWSTSNVAVATISGATASTVVVTGVAPGSVAITACSTVNTSVCGSATITVSAAPTATVSQVNVTPPSATVTKPATGSSTQQLAAAVVGTNNPSQTVTWTIVGSPAGASISTSGLLTILSTITVPSLTVSACSTVPGFTTVCGFSAITIGTTTPATVSLSGVTWVAPAGPGSCAPGPGPATPVVLTNVRCQIEVTANVNAGDVVLSRIDVVMTNTCTVPPNTAANCVTGTSNVRVMASQTFPGTVASDDGEAKISAPVDLTMSINTAQVRSPSGSSTNLVPAIFNGNATIQLVLYSAAGAQVASTTPTPVVMNNVDAVVYPTALTATRITLAGFTTGTTIAITGAQYISFSQTVPTSSGFTATLGGCGTSSSVVTGTPTTGIVLGGVFTCPGVSGTTSVSPAVVPTFTYAVATGPDGTPITPPAFYSTVGSAFQLPSAATFNATLENRWNLLLQNNAPIPAPVALTGVTFNNVGPFLVGFNVNFDQQWVNNAFDLTALVAIPGVTNVVVRLWNPTLGTCTGAVVTNPANLAETLTSSGFDAYQLCATYTDPQGVARVFGPTNKFGVDRCDTTFTGCPSVRLIFSTGVDPVGIYTTPNVSPIANTSKYQTIAAVENMPWGLEGQDTRSGFNQLVVTGDDAAHQQLIRLWPGAVAATGDAACTLSDQLVTLLSDGWKRTGLPAPAQARLDCGAGSGYYFYEGWVFDRAGNQSTHIVRNFVFDLGAPNMTGIGFASTFYTPGTSAPFSFSANDDLNVVSATIGFAMSGMPFPSVGINYPQCCLGNPPPPAFGITLGSGWGTLWPTTKSQLANIINGAVASVDNFLFRTDESCRFNGDPYTSCNVTANGTGSKPTVAADYNQNLYSGGTLTNQQKLPQAVLANVGDAVGRESPTGIIATMLNTQFSPSTGIAAPWGAAGCAPISSTCADIANWTAVIVGANAVATHKTQTSNGLPVFQDISLWRFNTTVNQWNFCTLMPNPTAPTIDNGTFRTYVSTVALPIGIAHPCNQLTGPWKVMGRVGGAGFFTPQFP
jgi:hypothetical protein